MTDQTYHLEDRYTAERSHVFMSGIQALARLPIEQLLADQRAGLRTAAFVCGYPGSPLGGFDSAIAEAAALRPDLTIHHQPGLNEEYAATAVMGSQLAGGRRDARYDGVLGMWYGKAPGVDRAVDAMRHATFAGTWHQGEMCIRDRGWAWPSPTPWSSPTAAWSSAPRPRTRRPWSTTDPSWPRHSPA